MPENRLVPLRPEPATTTSERAASVVNPGKTAPGYPPIGRGSPASHKMITNRHHTASPMEPPFSRHVLQRTVVLPELRVLFVPVPKAGCTTVLWQLAALAGIEPETFERSTLPEVSVALTVHDTSLWRPEHRLASYAGAE